MSFGWKWRKLLDETPDEAAQHQEADDHALQWLVLATLTRP